METLDGTDWDVVISGTGFAQSLLALSLSRSGKRILHLDERDYYGGDEAAFSLAEAETWATGHSTKDAASVYSHAAITTTSSDDSAAEGEDKPRIASSRAYSLTLSPQLIYSRSALVSNVVSSQIHNQLDFQAVGSWFVLHPRPPAFSLTRLSRVPSGREDVFSDTSLDLRAKQSLMKFLRFVSNYEEKTEVWEAEKETPFPTFLEQKFNMPPTLHAPIMALTMSMSSPKSTSTAFALPRIARHARSIGVFGPGFGAVLPKWGGLAEVVQVACRACAVGGGVYVLNKAIKHVEQNSSDTEVGRIRVGLDNGERVTTNWLVEGEGDLFARPSNETAETTSASTTSRSISIVSSPLTSLFPRTSEGGPIPAGAVVSVPAPNGEEPPVYVLAHTSEAGECPMHQCVLYASVDLPAEQGFSRLQQAVTALLDNVQERSAEDDLIRPAILWTMEYQQKTPARTVNLTSDSGRLTLPALSTDLAFDDSILDDVRTAWQTVTKDDAEAFMHFDNRLGPDTGDG